MGRKKQEGGSSAAAAATESGKEEEMEKQATDKGGDGRKGKQKGRGERKQDREKETGREKGDATAAGHRFFKVFFPEQSGERLVSFFFSVSYLILSMVD